MKPHFSTVVLYWVLFASLFPLDDFAVLMFEVS